MLYGVDVHPRYQAGINLELLPSQGYTFAAIKATQGEYLEVPQFGDWIRRVRAAGLIAGAYHWIVKGDGAGQADYFFSYLIRSLGPNALTDGLLVQLDCEDDATLEDVQAWAARWRRISNDHPFVIYTGKWWWGPRGWNGAAIAPLWDSHYLTADLDSVPDDPAAFAARIPASWWTPGYGNWKVATLLQFTSRGDAGGLANNVDLNATKLTLAQLQALAGLSPDGEDDMSPEQAQQLQAIRDATFFGGPSCGKPVPSDLPGQWHGTTNTGIPVGAGQSNSIVAKLDYVTAALAAGVPVDVDTKAIADEVVTQLMPQLDAIIPSAEETADATAKRFFKGPDETP